MNNALTVVRMTQKSLLYKDTLQADCQELSENLEWLGENVKRIVLTEVSAIHLTPSLMHHWRFGRVKEIIFCFAKAYSRMDLAQPVAEKLMMLKTLKEATQISFLHIKDRRFELLQSITDKINVGCEVTYKGP